MMVSPFTDWLSDVDIVSGDTVVVSSDILPILLKSRELGLKFKPIDLIEAIQDKVGVNGTLFFPTFNWGFCRGESFDIRASRSETGSLSQKTLQMPDINGLSIPFIRFLFGENVSGNLLD